MPAVLSTLLRHRPLHLLLVLATVLCAAGVATGSGASFGSASSAGAPLVSGTLLQTNSRTGAAVLAASGMRPGDTATGDVRITNSGTLPATFRLTETEVTNTFTAGSMTLRVVDVASGATVYDGDVGGLGSKALGGLAAGEARTYRFTARLSAAAPTVDQGKTARADYGWVAVPTADPAA